MIRRDLRCPTVHHRASSCINLLHARRGLPHIVALWVIPFLEHVGEGVDPEGHPMSRRSAVTPCVSHVYMIHRARYLFVTGI